MRIRSVPSARGTRRGLTLLELLLVMGLVAVVAGIGAGMLAGIDTTDRAAMGTVRSALRAARNSAVAHGGDARVRIDRPGNALIAEGLEVVGTWRFEDVLWKGAFGLDGVSVNGDPSLADGYLGNAVSFQGEARGTHLSFDVSEEPRFDLRRGFAFEVSVNLAGFSDSPLVDLGEVAGLDVVSDGGLVAWFRRGSDEGRTQVDKGTRVALESGGGVLRADRWLRLRVAYDQRLLTIHVDGVEVARVAVDGPVVDILGPVKVGGGRSVVDGRLDDLVVWAVVESMRVELPVEASFGKEAPPVVRFAAGGGLDPTVHREPVVLPVEFADGDVVNLYVGLFGTVDG